MEGAYTSQLLEKAVCEFSKLPGIGRKTALRLVLDLLRRTEEEVDGFATAVTRLRKEVKHCKVCHNISDTDVCRYAPTDAATARRYALSRTFAT